MTVAPVAGDVGLGRRDALDRVGRQRRGGRVALHLLGGEHPIAARDAAALRRPLSIVAVSVASLGA